MASDFIIEKNPHGGSFKLVGTLDLYHALQARIALESAAKTGDASMVDASGLTKLDTVGALILREFQERRQVELQGLRPEYVALFNMVARADVTLPPKPVAPSAVVRLLTDMGKATVTSYKTIIEITTFFGHACVSFSKAVLSPRKMRFPSIMHHIEQTGIHAIPIISLIAFLIAIVLAYQGIAQLRPLGGENYTVNLVAISVLREMGVLLTAIMVAGRSGSAFTAEIGVMKVREEVDALQVIGMDPFQVLVMPRLIALLISLPLLTFIANVMGLLGGAVICSFLIGIPLSQYIQRVHDVVRGHDYLVGMIKAPVFAFLIAVVGCMHGMKVSGSAESVGKETTTSVVKSIFLVLVADAIFSIFFQKVGL